MINFGVDNNELEKSFFFFCYRHAFARWSMRFWTRPGAPDWQIWHQPRHRRSTVRAQEVIEFPVQRHLDFQLICELGSLSSRHTKYDQIIWSRNLSEFTMPRVVILQRRGRVTVGMFLPSQLNDIASSFMKRNEVRIRRMQRLQAVNELPKTGDGRANSPNEWMKCQSAQSVKYCVWISWAGQ